MLMEFMGWNGHLTNKLVSGNLVSNQLQICLFLPYKSLEKKNPSLIVVDHFFY